MTSLMRNLPVTACFIWIVFNSGQVKGNCNSELGMQRNLIPDENITASSELSANHAPAFARLDRDKGAWCSAPNDSLPYIQILLDEEKAITKIMTQGSYKELRWATEYQIKYLKQGKWSTYEKADGGLKFDGNIGAQSLQEIDLQPPIKTRSIRIYPKAPFSVKPNEPRTLNNVSCLRLELYGCSAPDLNECERNTHDCHTFATCINERGSYSCKCNHGYAGDGFKCYHPYSCSVIRKYVSSVNGNYDIDPDGAGGLAPFTVYCDMSDKNGVGVTVISHDSENRTLVDGYDTPGSYSRDIHYTGASLSQLASLTTVSLHCEQFIKYKCYYSRIFRKGFAWWVSRDSTKMTYWGGASPGSGKCACGMTNSCADPNFGCNCDKTDMVWREDSGLLTDKTHLPVKQLRFGDTGYSSSDQGYHTLEKFKCYGAA